MFFMGKQTTCWTWDSKYAMMTTAQLHTELYAVYKQVPELFSLYGMVENKF